MRRRRWSGVVLAVPVVAILLAGCGSDERVSTATAPEWVRSDPTPHASERSFSTSSQLVRSAGAYLITDTGFPADVLRFDRVDPDLAPRVVNPPLPVFRNDVHPVDGGFVLVAQDCTGVVDPGDGEVVCPGPVVALRYDVARDAWRVLNDRVVPRVTTLKTVAGPPGSVVASYRTGHGGWGALHLVEIDVETGATTPIPAPPQTRDELWSASICGVPDGVVALSAPDGDILPSRSFASTWRFADHTWSDPVELPVELPEGLSAVKTCTDQGVALLGNGLDRDGRYPSLSFGGRSWTVSDAPDLILRSRLAPGVEGVGFADELWRHDAQGRWYPTGARIPPDAIGIARVDEGTVAVAVSDPESGDVRLHAVVAPASG